MAKDVLVIGAGIAGLTAARALKQAGYDVRVVDKGRRVGGRCNTRRMKDTLRFDHGAQYFTARTTDFEQQNDEWLRRGVAKVWHGRFAVAQSGRVTAKADNPTRYVGAPAMRRLAEDLASDLDVSTELRITSLQRDGRRWSACDEAGVKHGEAERVVVTAPAPQALELVKPSKSLSAVCVASRMMPCWAVMVEFSETVNVAFDGLFFEGEPLRFAARDSSKPGRDPGERWVLHASDAWSAQNVEASSSEVPEPLLGGFFDGLGLPHQLPKVIVAHRWRYATPTPSLETGAAFDAEQGLALAGDWLGGSRIEGAFVSGLTAARQIIQADR